MGYTIIKLPTIESADASGGTPKEGCVASSEAEGLVGKATSSPTPQEVVVNAIDEASLQQAIANAQTNISDSVIADFEKLAQDILRKNSDYSLASKLLLLIAQKRNDPVAWYELGRFFLGIGRESDAMHCCGKSLLLSITSAAQQQQLSSLQKLASDRPMQVAGRRVVVTGGASGIGKAIVERLVQMGAHVMPVDKDNNALDALAASMPRIVPISLDMNDLERSAAAVEKIDAVDVVVLNAAIYEEADFWDLDAVGVLRLMQNNFLGHVSLVRHLVRKMNGGGSIVIIGSGAEHIPVQASKCAHYLASKAALSSFFMASCNELKARRIMVNEVLCNDAFDTPMIRWVTSIPPGHLLADPKLVTEALIPFVIADPEGSFITGCSVIVQMRRE